MAKAIKNIGASVRARLFKLSKANGQSFDLVLTRFASERLLFRLSQSAHGDRFVLKGAMLMMSWFDDPHRGTRDLDLLGFGDPSEDAMLATFRDILSEDVEDCVVFDPNTLRVDRIREELEYGGLRLRTIASISGAQINLTIDCSSRAKNTASRRPSGLPGLSRFSATIVSSSGVNLCGDLPPFGHFDDRSFTPRFQHHLFEVFGNGVCCTNSARRHYTRQPSRASVRCCCCLAVRKPPFMESNWRRYTVSYECTVI